MRRHRCHHVAARCRQPRRAQYATKTVTPAQPCSDSGEWIPWGACIARSCAVTFGWRRWRHTRLPPPLALSRPWVATTALGLAIKLCLCSASGKKSVDYQQAVAHRVKPPGWRRQAADERRRAAGGLGACKALGIQLCSRRCVEGGLECSHRHIELAFLGGAGTFARSRRSPCPLSSLHSLIHPPNTHRHHGQAWHQR